MAEPNKRRHANAIGQRRLDCLSVSTATGLFSEVEAGTETSANASRNSAIEVRAVRAMSAQRLHN